MFETQLLVFCAFLTSVIDFYKYYGLDIIVLRYRALGICEISDYDDTCYRFRFCFCPLPSANPVLDRTCKCVETQKGETAFNSITKAVYSAGCVHGTKKFNCLIGSINSVHPKDALYVKISIGNLVLTYPPYQQIPMSSHKRCIPLSCIIYEQLCRNCKRCENGVIELTYIVQPLFKASKKQNLLPDLYNGKLKPHETVTVRQTPANLTRTFNFRHTKATTPKTIFGLLSLEGTKQYPQGKATEVPVAEGRFNVTKFKNEIIKYHNTYRKIHAANPLTHDNSLAINAQNWAKTLSSKFACISHDPVKRYGENLFFYAATTLPGEEILAKMVVHSFYSESKNYNYKTHENMDYHTRGHFTQLVWKGTTKLGIGVDIKFSLKNNGNSCIPKFPATVVYVVVKYDPPGNVHALPYYDKNVLPPQICGLDLIERNNL